MASIVVNSVRDTVETVTPAITWLVYVTKAVILDGKEFNVIQVLLIDVYNIHDDKGILLLSYSIKAFWNHLIQWSRHEIYFRNHDHFSFFKVLNRYILQYNIIMRLFFQYYDINYMAFDTKYWIWIPIEL